MIERHWKGIAKVEAAGNYVKHLRDDTFRTLESIPGFVRGNILTRNVVNGVEFLVITVWESYESIQQFAGAQIAVAVVPEVVQKMMLEFDNEVLYYEVVEL